jgi:Zn-finger nucleic acid-binding protein
MSDVSMNGLLCPHCRVDLVMSERHGVEIDYCPKCRGVWLDRGELDKILERAASYESQLPPPPSAPPQAGSSPWGNAAPAPVPTGGHPAYPAYPAQSPGHHGGHDSYGGGQHGNRASHHKSFLGRFFD